MLPVFLSKKFWQVEPHTRREYFADLGATFGWILTSILVVISTIINLVF